MFNRKSMLLVAMVMLFSVLMFNPVFGQDYPEKTIYDIQSSLVEGTDISTYEDSVFIFTGIVTSRSGLYYAGSGVTYYMQDPNYAEYAGVMIYHPEPSSLDPVFEGDEVRIVASVYEYNSSSSNPPYNINMTELTILPEYPAEFLSYGNEIEPTVITCADVDTANGLIAGEPYEGMLVQLQDVTFVGANNYNNWRLDDETGTAWVRIESDSLPEANEFIPEEGTQFESLTGVVYHRFGVYFIQPRFFSDIVYAGTAPVVSGTSHSPWLITPENTIRIVTTATDPNGEIDHVTLYYRVNGEDWLEMTMNPIINNQYEVNLDPQPAGTMLDYYVTAVDDNNEETTDPETAPDEFYSLEVIEAQATTVYNIQYTDDPGDDGTYPSPLDDELVEIEAVVLSDHDGDGSGFFVRGVDARDGEWTGVYVYDSGDFDPVTWQHVRLTGIIDEYYGLTEFKMTSAAADYEVLGEDMVVEPIAMTTGMLPYDDPDTSEPYEGQYVRLLNVNVTEVNTDDSNDNRHYIMIDDGSGPAKISIKMLAEDDLPAVGTTFNSVDGFVQYTYDNYFIFLARFDAVGVEDEATSLPKNYALLQNYPNPFNPTTVISFQLPVASQIDLSVYNTAGQLVKLLENGSWEPGNHEVVWDGTNDNGASVGSGIYFYRLKTDADYDEVKSMLLLK